MKNFIKEIEVNGVNHNITLGDDMVGSGLKKDENGVVNLDIIKITEEFYDDGSGQVVPIKHPDLSTQPSILPYKFMGQYVYEQLIPNNKGGVANVPFSSFAVPNPLIIEATSIYNATKIVGSDYTIPFLVVSGDSLLIQTSGISESENVEYFRIVYTSMPEEGDYYGYNNY